MNIKMLSLFFLFIFYFFIPTTQCKVFTEEKPLVVVIPSYNNRAWFKKNLESVCKQNYSSYRIIYIDDCSDDGTYELVRRYIIMYGLQDRVTLIRNTKRCGALANHYRANYLCKDYEIVVQLDGDDWFAHDDVLARINQAYQDPDVWMTYGQYKIYPSDKVGICKDMPPGIVRKVAYRESAWFTSALRTFYAGLFKKIDLQDLLYEGDFFATTCDFAFMLPMLEMADGRVKFINEVLYIYNCKTGNNDYKKNLQLQLRTENLIRSRRKYTTLEEFSSTKSESNVLIDIIVFSKNNPDGLRLFLESLYGSVSGLGSVGVLYQTAQETMYEELFTQFPYVDFVCIKEGENFKQFLLDACNKTDNNYLTFVHDSMVVHHFVDLAVCAGALEKTRAYGFYLSLGHNITQCRLLEREQKQPSAVQYDGTGVYAWQFKDGEYDWAAANNVMMTVYPKARMLPLLSDAFYSDVQTLEKALNQSPIDQEAVGLFFDESKVMQLQQNTEHLVSDPIQFFGQKNTQICFQL